MAVITSWPPNSKLNPPSSLLKTIHKPARKPLLFNLRQSISSYNISTISTPRNRNLTGNCRGFLSAHDKRKKEVPSVQSISTVEESKFHKLLWSDVIVNRPRNVFVGRKWNSLDIATAGVVVIMHVLALFAPFTFNWDAFWVAVALYVVTGLLGICLSFHRNLSHRSFKLPKWLEYFCSYCGVQALQGNPIDWVSTHRYHHQYCDSEKDPHSPLEGFWFSHMSWLFYHNAIVERCGEPSNVADLEKQPFYRFIRSTYVMHPLALGALLYAMGGFPYLAWGMGVRTIWVYHITWLVNSACHVWGSQAWNTGDLSRNNWWVAMLSFGEGWHNNHHAFEYSAQHGLEWWQIDITWYTVRLLEAIGLATDVKLPAQVHKQRMAFKSQSMAA